MKTNVNFRKFTSLLLTIIMILSMGVTSVFAEDTTAETITITVNGVDYVTCSAEPTKDGETAIKIASKATVDYEVVAEEAGLYNVALTYKKTDSKVWYYLTSNPIKHEIKGTLNKTTAYEEVSTWTGDSTPSAIQLYLNKGTNIVTYKAAGQSYVSKMVFTKEKTGDTTTIYQYSRGHCDSGIYDPTSNEANTDESKIIRDATAIAPITPANSTLIVIGKTTYDSVDYGAFVKYNVYAHESGIYKITLNSVRSASGLYKTKLHALKNETIGFVDSGYLPGLTGNNNTGTTVNTWQATTDSDAVDILIPMVKGNNVISFSKSNDYVLKFNRIEFTKVDEYDEVTVKALDYFDGGLYEKTDNADNSDEAKVNRTDEAKALLKADNITNGVRIGGKTLNEVDSYGSFVKYNVYAPETATYKVELNLINDSSSLNALRNETIDYTTSGYIPAVNSVHLASQWSLREGGELVDITIPMVKGNNVISLSKANGSFAFNTITFTKAGEYEVPGPSEGYYSAVNAVDTDATEVDGKLNMTEGKYAKYNITSEDSLYLVTLILDATEDSLIKVTVGEECVYGFVTAERTESYLLINMPANEKRLEVSVEKGEISLEEINFYKELDNIDYYSQALSDFAAATTVDDAKQALEKVNDVNSYVYLEDLDNIFYKDSVINLLKEDTYSDIATLLSDYSEIIYNERNNPSIVLKNEDGNAVNALEAGAMSLSVKADWLNEEMSVYLAIYDGNKLVAVDTKDYVANGITLNVTIPEEGSYTYRIFVWENMTPYSFDDTSDEINKVYVSVSNSSDNNDGSINAPVATIEKAKEIANDMKYSLNSDIYVVMGAGNYYIEKPIEFTEADSALSEEYKIKYIGDENGATVINGGKEVKETEYEITDQLLTATIDINDARQLYVNGKPATMSVSEQIVPNALYNAVYDEEDDTKITSAEGIIVDTNILPPNFSNETSAEIVYYNTWHKSRFPVTKIEDLGNGTTALTLGGAFSYLGSAQLKNFTGYEIYLENCDSYLSEGEFCFDRKNQKLRYCKAVDEEIETLYVPFSEGLINIFGTQDNKVRNIVFENITFENGAWNYPSENGLYIRQSENYYTAKGQEGNQGNLGSLIDGQIKLNYCDGIEFNNNTVRNVGSAAFALNEAATNCEINGNKIYNTAAGGVILGSNKHFNSVSESRYCVGNTISYNEITDISLQYSTSTAITTFFATDTTITKNTIKNTPYSGIALGWGWGTEVNNSKNNEISYNYIENVMTVMNDGAHIYTNGHMEDAKIFGNYMIKSSDDSGRYGGIYLDNGSCNIEVYDNVVKECRRWLFINLGTSDITANDNYTDNGEYATNNTDPETNINVQAAGSDEDNKAETIKNNAGA